MGIVDKIFGEKKSGHGISFSVPILSVVNLLYAFVMFLWFVKGILVYL